jgi:hypothetical protein
LPAEGGSEALQFDPAMFDGRMALILKDGQRIGIADVTPLFACGISAPDQRALAMAVECSVFQVRTPDGHVFTIPLHEIRAFHSMTPELWDRVQRQARAARPRRTRRGETDEVPFGFAAFTSMARGIAGMPALPGEAPAGPTE